MAAGYLTRRITCPLRISMFLFAVLRSYLYDILSGHSTPYRFDSWFPFDSILHFLINHLWSSMFDSFGR